MLSAGFLNDLLINDIQLCALFSTKKFGRLVKSRIVPITINEVPAMKKRKNRCREFKSKEKISESQRAS